jgi:hypothetical protein
VTGSTELAVKACRCGTAMVIDGGFWTCPHCDVPCALRPCKPCRTMSKVDPA